MSISEPFIRRPIATSLLMLGVLVFGIAAYGLLPVAALPNVDFPTITVTAQYPGASPDTMASAVATPLEQQFAAIPVLDQMTSTSGIGTTSITLQFDLSRNIDGAAQDVQTGDQRGQRAAAEGPAEPADLPQDQPGRSSGADLRRPFRCDAGLSGRRLRLHDPGAAAIDGAGRVGGSDLRAEALCGARADQSRGAGLPRSRLRGRAHRAGGSDGRPAEGRSRRRASDLHARHQRPAVQRRRLQQRHRRLSATARRSASRMSAEAIDRCRTTASARGTTNTPAEGLAIQRQAGANTIQLVDTIKAMMPQLEASIPPSVKVDLVSDRSLMIRAAVHDVQFTMMVTIGLVILVIFLFLRTLWATVIPSMAVPLSLLATFAVMYAAGYSLDNISLMALTISVGFIVDDAIVMIENIVRYIEQGDAAVRRGAERRRPDRLHDHFDHLFADRGVHSAVVHGRDHRPAVPRIRRHRVGRGGGLGGDFADVDAGLVLAVPEGARAAPGKPPEPDRRRRLRLDAAHLRQGARLRFPPPICDLAVDLGA